MLVSLFSLLAIALYLGVSVMLWRGVRSGRGRPTRRALYLWALAMLAHSGALLPEIITRDGVDLSLFNASALSALLIALILFITCIKQALSVVAFVVLPLTALLVALAPIETSEHIVRSTTFAGMQLHIVASLLAYSLLVMASIQALTLYLQIKYLKFDWSLGRRLFATLPPFEAMESFLFALLRVGVLLLTVSLISGWLYHDDLFAQHLVHKTVLSTMAWLVFGIVLVGKQLYGWRTNTAVALTLTATALLILAYLGSKFVLEVILDRI